MKLSPLIAQYLQANRSLNIEGFGKFFIDELAGFPEEGERPNKNPLPIQYTYAPNTTTDLAFVDFIVKETGKIRPLAVADLETYISLAKQLLNISKPFVIEGVGTLVNNNKGSYEFIPGHYEPPKINTDSEREKKLRSAGDTYEKLNAENYAYGREQPKGFSIKPRQALLLLAGLVIIGGVAWAVLQYLSKKDTPKTQKTEITETGDRPNTQPADDTLAKNKPKAPPVFTDSNQVISYKVIHEIATKDRAQKRYAKLMEYKDKTEMEAIDSNTYKLFIRVSSAVRDTGRMKNSIRANYKNAIYKGPTLIEF